MGKHLIFLTITFTLSSAVYAATPDCRQTKIENTEIQMCLTPGDIFKHDVYTLKADKVIIFSLVDDFVENVKLKHTIPDGLTIEFPLSKQGEKSVEISGGCVPVSKDQVEVARVCNFNWGKYQIVKDVRFDFK
ncbi:hypothetical protein ACXX82_10530 [Glaciimonas sp. GNP009]|uniref:hypothetical protein n=1 Tax=Glaciimonas sp. CA11.2 TaxID=3048601 RepID=UPI002AB38533|nr:hypothetical protein [Glaciimonas sp. CA11.2]MDY7546021.1 hypothetical protein [Glaciimonas sp. CA11.2]